MSFTDPTVISVGIYLFAMLFIGFLGYRDTDNLDDYILGGRSLGSFVTALVGRRFRHERLAADGPARRDLSVGPE